MPDMGEDRSLVTARQIAQYEALESVVEVFGEFTQDIGPDGAHYVPESPFPEINCANCVAYMSAARACEWVEGDIAPEGVCKLWIIPGQRLGMDEGMMDASNE